MVMNNIIRGTTEAVAISNKVQKRLLQWYGYVRKREESSIEIMVLEM